ncbi:hypothetical protein [Candidatus Phytoplasma pini]|uniref:Uncharacterized protein n=1 Tax=Candidatus Phytoplasma pini TaxID=267362 RepID=A0A559KJ89_9MOLU|nr:hypothetical protein [Candidatus Phytoplasma pini]TVY12190.1 hypothetical protein MDPP_00258 [Candidatus Phytoplasma pini]
MKKGGSTFMATIELNNENNDSKLSTKLKQLHEMVVLNIKQRKDKYREITNMLESYYVAFNKVSKNKGAGH